MRLVRRRMQARDRGEANRSSTPLELMFDLCFVVAVGQAADRLHHALAEGHPAVGVLSYVLVFFVIWWAWITFTWFASAYDCDDVAYRLLTMLQIAGGLLLAAGVAGAFDSRDYTLLALGYVLMRVALVTQWLRVAHDYPLGRASALRYAAGLGFCQMLWLALLVLPSPWGLLAFPVVAALELAVPVWAEHAGEPIAWHPGHIADRYGVFTLIVLGESVFAATNTVHSALVTGGLPGPLVVVATGGLVLILALWWSYFDHPATEGLRLSANSAFVWGYGHLVVFAALAAVGVGIQVVAESVGDHADLLSPRTAALTLALPTALYLVTIGVLHGRLSRNSGHRTRARFTVSAVTVIGVAACTPWIALTFTVPAIGLVVAGLVGLNVVRPPAGKERVSADAEMVLRPPGAPATVGMTPDRPA